MAAATSCFALASCPRMSVISWFSIFSGFSAFEIRSLRFDLISVERRSRIPMSAPRVRERIPPADFGQRSLRKVNTLRELQDLLPELRKLFRHVRQSLIGARIARPHAGSLADRVGQGRRQRR